MNFSSGKRKACEVGAMLYAHIPFCVKKCLFCSFAVAIAQTQRADEYLDALLREAKNFRGSRIKSVYLGGGTPTVLGEDQLARLVKNLRGEFLMDPDAEWTIEANPEGINENRAQALRALGFTRVSLGVQSFEEPYLKFLGRGHTAAQARAAFGVLRKAGFGNINVDLMYGFPGQARDELKKDIEAVAALGSEHVSVYTLTIEPNSRFYARQMKLDDDDKLAEDYVFVTQSLERAGLTQYEVSNFARPGFESRHNMGYWTGVEYIGLGMGAHSFMEGRRYWNIDRLPAYISAMAQGSLPVAGEEKLSLRTRFLERLVFGLRMNRGIDLSIIEKELKMAIPKETLGVLDQLAGEGFLRRDGGRVAVTPKGRLVLDELSARLM